MSDKPLYIGCRKTDGNTELRNVFCVYIIGVSTGLFLAVSAAVLL